MTKNMGALDRTLRLLVAVALAVLYFTGIVGGWLGWILMLVAIVFLLTSLFGSCPAYMPFGISTCKPPAGPSSTA